MKSQNTHSWIGIVLVAIGGLLVVNNFGFFDFNLGHLIFSWHTIALVIGIIILSNSKSNVAGIILVLLGLWGTAEHIFPWFDNIGFGDVWPLILIVAGLSLLLRKKDFQSDEKKKENNFQYASYHSSNEFQTNSDIIDEVVIFTSTRRNIHATNFKGGKVTALFGGANLDFAQAKMAPGENHLEIACIFGGCKIFVPRDWKVIVNVTSVFGGIDDKRYVSYELPNSEGVLIIKGAVIFGGSEIYSI